ncbi:MAG: glycosyltransferase family 2 protein [Candidatus Aminicenantales bacterium]
MADEERFPRTCDQLQGYSVLEEVLKLERNPSFVLKKANGQILFVHESGWEVLGDALGRLIWESLPETIGGLEKKAQETLSVPEGTASDFATLMREAGLIRSHGADVAQESSLFSFPAGPLVSAIIVTRNGEAHIGGCLASLFRQTYRNLEVIVVDNGSTDGTARIVGEYPKAAFHALCRNVYYPGGINYGIGKASGDFFLILNDDTEIAPDCVSRLMEKATSNPAIGATVPMMKFYHLRGFINGIGNHVRVEGWGSDNFIGAVDIGQYDELADVPSACFGAVLIKREAVADVGRLDRSYKSYYEDVDWSFRCWFRGWKIAAAPKAIVFHKFGGSWTVEAVKLKLTVANRIRLILKLVTKRTALSALRNYLREDIRNFFALAVRRKDLHTALAYPKAYLSLILGLPGILFKRLRILSRRGRVMNAKQVMAKNPSNWTFLDVKGRPILDADAYFTYYRKELAKSKLKKGVHRITTP